MYREAIVQRNYSERIPANAKTVDNNAQARAKMDLCQRHCTINLIINDARHLPLSAFVNGKNYY